jgi:hypothetical protein
MPPATQTVVESVQSLCEMEQLVLIVGKPGSGKSKIMRELGARRGFKYMDAQQLITDEILELMPKTRSQEAPDIMEKIVVQEEVEVVLLDGLQILFAPILRLDPLALLRRLSEKHKIVAAWPGGYQDGKLTYLELGKTKPKFYNASDLKIIEID